MSSFCNYRITQIGDFKKVNYVALATWFVHLNAKRALYLLIYFTRSIYLLFTPAETMQQWDLGSYSHF